MLATIIGCVLAAVEPASYKEKQEPALFVVAHVLWIAGGLVFVGTDTWSSRSDAFDITGPFFAIYLFLIIGMVEAFLLLPQATSSVIQHFIIPDTNIAEEETSKRGIQMKSVSDVHLLEKMEGQNVQQMAEDNSTQIVVSSDSVANSADAPAPPKKERARMDFLDNIKVYLTFLVILFHVICVCGPRCFHFSFTTVDSLAIECARACVRNFTGSLTDVVTDGPFSAPGGGTTVGAARRACMEAAGSRDHPLMRDCGGPRVQPFSEMISNSFFQNLFATWALHLNQSYFMVFACPRVRSRTCHFLLMTCRARGGLRWSMQLTMLSVFAAPTRADILLLSLRLLHTDELGPQGLARLHCGQGQAPWLASACLAVWTWPTDALLVLRIRRNRRRISVDIESWPPLVHCMVACVQFALRVHGRRACKGQSSQKNMCKAIHPT